MLQNRFSVAPDGTHLALGLAAAPAIEGFGHLPAQLPEITFSGHQAESVACFFAAAEDGRYAAAAVGNGIRQIPDCIVVQVFFKMHHVAFACVFCGYSGENPLFQAYNPIFQSGFHLVHTAGGCAGFLLGIALVVVYDRLVAKKEQIQYTITGYARKKGDNDLG